MVRRITFGAYLFFFFRDLADVCSVYEFSSLSFQWDLSFIAALLDVQSAYNLIACFSLFLFSSLHSPCFY